MRASDSGPEMLSCHGAPALMRTALPGPVALKFSESPPRA